MRRLRSVSLLMVVLGVVLLTGSLLLGLGPGWTLGGVLLTWAGIVKVVVVHLWRGITPGGGLSTGGDDA